MLARPPPASIRVHRSFGEFSILTNLVGGVDEDMMTVITSPPSYRCNGSEHFSGHAGQCSKKKCCALGCDDGGWRIPDLSLGARYTHARDETC